MKAILLRETGGPERLELADVAEPEAEEGQAVVDVRAAGVNFMDVLIRRGEYPQPPELPAVLGGEISGEVDGRRVMAMTPAGGYAERVGVDRRSLVSLPDGASFAEGASFLMTFLTAYIPLTRQARVGKGTTVLVHAAAGGVGSAAVQVARHLGAEVLATVGSDEKREFARSLGATHVWGYDDFADEARVDVVFDPVGGKVFADSVACVNPLGALVAVGYAAGMWQPVDPALLVGRNLSVVGFYLGRLMRLQPRVVEDAARAVVELWASGAVRPVVGAEFALGDAAKAHRLIEERGHVGKVVLVP